MIEKLKAPQVWGALLLVLISLHMKDNYTHFQWQWGFYIAVILACLWIVKEYALVPAVVLGYFLIHTFITARHFAVLGWFLAPIALAAVTQKGIRKSMDIFGLINSLYVIFGAALGFGWYHNGVGYSGLLDYSSINGSLIALSVPFAIENKRYWMLPVYLVAIFLSYSSIPWGVLAVILGVMYFRVLLYTAPLGLCGFFFDWGTLFDDSGRFKMYKYFLNYWYEQAHYLCGLGASAFHVYGWQIQRETGIGAFPIRLAGRDIRAMGYWPHLHSDPLETLWNYGAIGLLLCVLLSIATLYKLSKKDLPACYAFSGVLAATVFNYPLRYFPFAVIASALVVEAFKRDNNVYFSHL